MMKLTISMAMLALFASTSAMAQGTVRLVMSHSAPGAKSEQSIATQKSVSLPGGCLSAPNGEGEWCIKNKSHSLTRGSSEKTIQSRFEIITLDSYGYKAQTIADMLSRDGRFGTVEADIATSTPIDVPVYAQATGDSVRNDAAFELQKTYLGSSEEYVMGTGVTDAWFEYDSFFAGEPIDVIILDSSFGENEDVTYYDGRSFATTALIEGGGLQIPNDDYRPIIVPDMSSECTNHGLGVAGVVAAHSNNSVAGAGIINNINLHAIRVMTCGSGMMSDSAEAINWLAGDAFSGVTPYSGKPGVINLSLSGYAPDGCPEYTQSAINRVVDAGFSVVVSASNDAMDAKEWVPANCDNVVVAGGLDTNGELAWYSNFGENVDVVVQSDSIISPCDEISEACLWGGTSFASPIVAAMVAATRQQTGADNQIIHAALEMTSSQDHLKPSCGTDMCGAGIPNLPAMMSFAKDSMSGKLNTINFALAEEDPCEQSWFLDNFGDAIPMCELYKVSFMGGYQQNGVEYELVSIEATASWSDTQPEVVMSNMSSESYVSDLDLTGKQYAFRVCEAGVCSIDVTPMNLINAQEDHRPAACKK